MDGGNPAPTSITFGDRGTLLCRVPVSQMEESAIWDVKHQNNLTLSNTSSNHHNMPELYSKIEKRIQLAVHAFQTRESCTVAALAREFEVPEQRL